MHTLDELRARAESISCSSLGWLVAYANVEAALDHGAVNGRWTRADVTDVMRALHTRLGGIPNVYGRLYEQTAAVVCRKCAPDGAPLPVTMSAYMRAMHDSDDGWDGWECPRCGGVAAWDRMCPESRPAALLATEAL